MDAIAPAEEDKASCVQVALCPSSPTPMKDFAAAFPPNNAKDPGAFYICTKKAMNLVSSLDS
jgi:hypothetical protein